MALEGTPEFNRALARMTTRMGAAGFSALGKAAFRLEAAMKRRASGRPGPNVITGTLRRSIAVSGPVRRGGVAEATVGPSVVYAEPVEALYPFVGPAVAAFRPAYPGLIAAAVAAEMRRAG